jgi:UDP-glucose 4-epimerase
MWLVTGGAGFIGTHLVQRLVDDGQSVRVLDNFSTGKRSRLENLRDRIEIISGDVRDDATVRTAMRGVTTVLHQAAQASVPLSVADPVGTYAVNMTGTLNVLNAARDAGTHRVVLASTSAVYGNDPTSPKSEMQTPQPVSPYASSKLSTEQLAAVFTAAYGLECVALRYFNVYGPGQDPNSAYAAVIPRLVDLLHRGELPTIYGDGGQTRDFVYVGDVVTANLKAASSTIAPGNVYNIASGQSVTILELVGAVASILGTDAAVNYMPERAGDIRHSLADVTKAKRELGFTATTTLTDGLAQTIGAVQIASAA